MLFLGWDMSVTFANRPRLMLAVAKKWLVNGCCWMAACWRCRCLWGWLLLMLLCVSPKNQVRFQLVVASWCKRFFVRKWLKFFHGVLAGMSLSDCVYSLVFDFCVFISSLISRCLGCAQGWCSAFSRVKKKHKALGDLMEFSFLPAEVETHL